MRTRIAPTPSGYLHIGNACSFLLTQHLAKQYNGTIRLRIDDLDSKRTKQDYIADIFETLQFFSIQYQEGPEDVTDFKEHFSQHLRLPLYNHFLNELCDTGLVYGCTCSRKTLSENGRRCDCKKNKYPLHVPGIAWRVYTPDNTIIQFVDDKMGEQSIGLPNEMCDFVVRKKDGLPSYQVASLADDIHYNINYIVRGEDLLPSTAAQLYLAQITDKPSFINNRFYHHPILKDVNGMKLSKSAGATSVKVLRQNNLLLNTVEALIKEWEKQYDG